MPSKQVRQGRHEPITINIVNRSELSTGEAAESTRPHQPQRQLAGPACRSTKQFAAFQIAAPTQFLGKVFRHVHRPSLYDGDCHRQPQRRHPALPPANLAPATTTATTARMNHDYLGFHYRSSPLA